LDANEKSKLEKLFPKPQSTGQKREFDNSATTSGTFNETPVMKKGKTENDELKAALKVFYCRLKETEPEIYLFFCSID